MDLNKAMIIGRLTRDPESRQTPNGVSVCNFSMATNFKWGDEEKVEYHNIVAWNKLADICTQYLQKGMKVYIEGRIQTQSWNDKDGKKCYKTEIVASNMIILSNKKEQDTEPSPAMNQPPLPQRPPEDDINVEDIPF